jgi:adenylyltransferase/sulfurtransferase
MEPIVHSRALLTDDESRRYSRHLILPEVGREGQERLKAAKVLLVGAGGLGSPVAMYLAAAGVGTVGMADFDVVDASNLQRQILHATNNVGKSKLESARERIATINPRVKFVGYEARLEPENALEILRGYDVVVDGTDNFPTRYLVNDACVLLGKPNVYGAIFRFEGMVSVFAPHLGGSCYRCWYPEPPEPGMVPSCAEAGVLGAICGVVGSLQATETIKLILGRGEPLLGRLLRFDALAGHFRELRLSRDEGCALCGNHPTIRRLVKIPFVCSSNSSDDISVEELKAMLERSEDFLLVDVRDPEEVAVSAIRGSIKLPLPELPRRFGELPKDKLIVLHCQRGGRSARALNFLREQGYTRLKNVAGGMAEWEKRFGN